MLTTAMVISSIELTLSACLFRRIRFSLNSLQLLPMSQALIFYFFEIHETARLLLLSLSSTEIDVRRLDYLLFILFFHLDCRTEKNLSQFFSRSAEGYIIFIFRMISTLPVFHHSLGIEHYLWTIA